MTVSEPLDLSSCLLCGRPLDGAGVERSYGGLEVEVHPDCAEAGLEGRDLASPHGRETGEAGPDGEAGSDRAPSQVPEASEGRGEGAEGGADDPEGPGEAGSGGERETRAGRDPEWTRITDFG